MRPLEQIERLESYVAETERAVFVWGQMDCALWVAGAIQAITGVDPAADLRGRYASEQEAEILLGSDGLEGFVSARLRPIALAEAGVGDVVLLVGRTLGVVQGRFAWAMGPRGIQRVPMEFAEKAWAV